MALSSFPGAPFMRSPHVEFEWAGWRASGQALQRCGWDFEQFAPDPFGRVLKLAMRHRAAGWAGVAECPEEALLRATSMGYGRGDERPPLFRVVRMANKAGDYVIERNFEWRMDDFRAVSMTPEIVQMHRMTLDQVFADVAREEIIVEPATVSSLLDQIKRLQAPDLARIREENRKRERREASHREIACAQIITLEAA